MRINIYAEELTERVQVIEKTVDNVKFYGARIYLELPVTEPSGGGVIIHKGPFMHRPGDDDSAAVTFWHTSPDALKKALAKLYDVLP